MILLTITFLISTALLVLAFVYRDWEIKQGRFNHIDLSTRPFPSMAQMTEMANHSVHAYTALFFAKFLSYISEFLHTLKQKSDLSYLHLRKYFESRINKSRGSVSIFLQDIEAHKRTSPATSIPMMAMDKFDGQ